MLKWLDLPFKIILPTDVEEVIHLLPFVGVVEELIFYHWSAHTDFRILNQWDDSGLLFLHSKRECL